MKEIKIKTISVPFCVSQRDIPVCVRPRHEAGVALIITIFLSAIMLTSVGVFAKEMAEEAINSARIDNSLIAYYAAEAGIEDALLFWRYDKDSEISRDNDENSNLDVTETVSNTPRCINLEDDTRDDNYSTPTECSKTNKPFGNRYYAMRMWYKTNEIKNYQLNRDDVLEIEVPNLTGKVDLSWVIPKEIKDLLDIMPPSQKSGFSMEITAYDENGNIISKEEGGKFFTPTKDYQVYLRNTRTKIIRIKPWYTKAVFNDTDPRTEGAPIAGVIPSVLINATSGDLMTTPITHIESIGYYGGVARKISVDLDRATGKIIGMLDYAIYSEATLVK